MPKTSEWFTRVGFTVDHTPGVARAWRYEFAGGNYVLVTSLDGFDLPERGGPYSSMLLSASDQLIEHQEYLKSTRQLIYWFAHAARVTDG
jgi:hypothetical protein